MDVHTLCCTSYSTRKRKNQARKLMDVVHGFLDVLFIAAIQEQMNFLAPRAAGKL